MPSRALWQTVKNLRDFLVRASLKPVSEHNLNPNPDFFCNLKFVQNRRNKKLFKISQIFSPQSANIVYVIFCAKCGIQYVGETHKPIIVRMWQHLHNIKKQRETDTLLIKHFISHGWSSVRVAGLQYNSSWTKLDRIKMERKWTYLLDTKDPYGLNKVNY